MQLAAAFWPGPLTLVLPRTTLVPDEVTAGLAAVAIRVPAHPVARALLQAAQLPVAAPSANLFSRPSPTRASHVMDDLNGRIDMVLDGGATSVGVESTVLDLSHGGPTILRPGAVTAEMLAAVLPAIDLDRRPGPSDDALPSPGLLEKHYSPRAPLTLFEEPGATPTPYAPPPCWRRRSGSGSACSLPPRTNRMSPRCSAVPPPSARSCLAGSRT